MLGRRGRSWGIEEESWKQPTERARVFTFLLRLDGNESGGSSSSSRAAASRPLQGLSGADISTTVSRGRLQRSPLLEIPLGFTFDPAVPAKQQTRLPARRIRALLIRQI
jgi:hypothetical protein